MNNQRLHYFLDHPKVEFGFFTSDDVAFLPNSENHAINHSVNRKDNKVDKVTREEAYAWVKETYPGIMADYDLKISQAEKGLEEAKAALAGLPKTAGAAKVGAANKAVAAIEKELNYLTGIWMEYEDKLKKVNRDGASTGTQDDKEATVDPANDPNLFPVVVDEQILADNPEMAEQDVKVGDTIYVPKDDSQNTPDEIKEDVKAAAKKGAVKKGTGGKKGAKK